MCVVQTVDEFQHARACMFSVQYLKEILVHVQYLYTVVIIKQLNRLVMKDHYDYCHGIAILISQERM